MPLVKIVLLSKDKTMTTKSEKQQAMFSKIESWKNSGQSQQDFCKTENLAYSGFHYWYKKYRGQQATRALPSFVPVHIKSMQSGSCPMAELIFPDGRRVNFYQSIDASFLRTLLS